MTNNLLLLLYFSTVLTNDYMRQITPFFNFETLNLSDRAQNFSTETAWKYNVSFTFVCENSKNYKICKFSKFQIIEKFLKTSDIQALTFPKVSILAK